MAQIPIPGTYRVVARLVRGSEQIVNVFHTSFLDNNAAERTAVAEAFSFFYEQNAAVAAPNRGINALLDSGVMLDSITVQDVSTVPYDAPQDLPSGVNGANVADALPLQSTINIQWRSAISSRNSRGRSYLGGFTIASLDDPANQSSPFVTAATLTDVGSAVTDLFARLALLPGIDLVVASLFDGVDVNGAPIPRAAGVTFVITSAKVANKFGTQRRRANKQLASDAIVIVA